MLQVAICDDNNIICSEIENIIIEYGNKLNLNIDIEVFTKGEDLFQYIKSEHEFDLIFLDIQLGTTTGVIISQLIRNKLNDHISKIVFISSVDGYEMELFKVQPLDFLRKPISVDDIYKCLNLVSKILHTSNVFFEFKVNKNIIKINTSKILYFESTLRKIRIVTTKEVFTFYDKLSSIKEVLPTHFFVPHSSYIVNYNNVKLIYSDKIIMENGYEIPISRSYQKEVQAFQIKLFKENKNVGL